MTVPSDEQLPAGYRFVRSSASGGIVRVGGDNGVGGSSSVAVYLAVNDVLGRQVAVKAVSVGRLVDPWSAATTVREAQTLAQLNHPNIVRVYELVSRGDLDLIVMEFVGGGTLADLVGRPEPGRNVRLRLLIETAAGLGYLHRAGV
ncbi:MAG TPA: protein kinase, partial [Ilumatobacteraceae bacterium]